MAAVPDFERVRRTCPCWRSRTHWSTHTHRPAFIGLLVIGAVVGVAVGGVLALVTSSAGYPEWTLILFQFIALAAVAVLPIGLGIRAVTHDVEIHHRQAG